MKTYKGLYPLIYDFENLYMAYLEARGGHRYEQEVLIFTNNLESELIGLQNDLMWKTYKTGTYRFFWVHDPKKRLVAALPFRDRVLHHALCQVIEPIFEPRFIHDTYACRVGKGTHRGARRTAETLREAERQWGHVYCLKGDIRKYFEHINHRILTALLARKIACPDTMWLIAEILGSTADSGDPDPVGIPLGNLTSQLWANIYLHEMDLFVKHRLGVRFYVRYMDDFVIFAADKETLWEWYGEIEALLHTKLHLDLNAKTDIFPVASRGIDFLGYRIWSTHSLLRKASTKRIRRAIKKFQQLYADGLISYERINATIQSWLAHAKHADTHSLRTQILAGAAFTRNDSTGGDDHADQ